MTQHQQQRLEVATKIVQALIAEPLNPGDYSMLHHLVNQADRGLPTADRIAIASLAVADALLVRTVLPKSSKGDDQ